MIFQIHFTRLFIVLGLFSILSSCLKDKATKPIEYICDESISYSDDIAAMIIEPTCNIAGCHNTGTSAGGYSFSNYAAVSSNSEIILKALTHQNEVTPMPLGGTMIADSLIKKFYCWIEQGKLDN